MVAINSSQALLWCRAQRTFGYCLSSRFRMSFTRAGGSAVDFRALAFAGLAALAAAFRRTFVLATGIDTTSKAAGLQSQEQRDRNGIHHLGRDENYRQ